MPNVMATWPRLRSSLAFTSRPVFFSLAENIQWCEVRRIRRHISVHNGRRSRRCFDKCPQCRRVIRRIGRECTGSEYLSKFGDFHHGGRKGTPESKEERLIDRIVRDPLI